MSTYQSVRFATRPEHRRRVRRRGAVAQFLVILSLLAAAVLVSLQLNDLALNITR